MCDIFSSLASADMFTISKTHLQTIVVEQWSMNNEWAFVNEKNEVKEKQIEMKSIPSFKQSYVVCHI